MRLLKAIKQSEYDTAVIDTHGLYTVVSPSDTFGMFDISEGEIGMPPRETVTGLPIEAVLTHKMVLPLCESNEWEPVNEQE